MQKYTSKATSVNATKLPKLYSSIDWQKLASEAKSEHIHTTMVFDYGCGRYTDHLKAKLEAELDNKHKFVLLPFDLYNQSEQTNATSKIKLLMQSRRDKKNVIALCSNVLNVIAEDEVVSDIASELNSIGSIVLATTYEGNKSGVGAVSKADCYQRNQKTSDYKQFLPNCEVRKSVLTNRTDLIK